MPLPPPHQLENKIPSQIVTSLHITQIGLSIDVTNGCGHLDQPSTGRARKSIPQKYYFTAILLGNGTGLLLKAQKQILPTALRFHAAFLTIRNILILAPHSINHFFQTTDGGYVATQQERIKATCSHHFGGLLFVHASRPMQYQVVGPTIRTLK